MVNSYIHRCVGAFYAPHAGEGNQILQYYTSKSVEKIYGHSTMSNAFWDQRCGPAWGAPLVLAALCAGSVAY
jgi:hypothetical protein